VTTFLPRISGKNEDGLVGPRFKREDLPRVIAQEMFDASGRAIADTEPNQLGWAPKQKAPVMEIQILGDNNKPLTRCIPPNLFINGSAEAAIVNVT
jgi:hypothetical protein